MRAWSLCLLTYATIGQARVEVGLKHVAQVEPDQLVVSRGVFARATANEPIGACLGSRRALGHVHRGNLESQPPRDLPERHDDVLADNDGLAPGRLCRRPLSRASLANGSNLSLSAPERPRVAKSHRNMSHETNGTDSP
jgi:hypothetical protein